jgi:hypothetical protein
LNSVFYVKILDVIFRCKGNYLWRGMWDGAFWIDDEENHSLADEYGVVMGTTHGEFEASWDKE